MRDDDFYEEDEPVQDLLAEFDGAAEGGKTQRPPQGQTQWLVVVGVASDSSHRDRDTSRFFAA
ncbi:hypothetical protein [Actinoplanes sp. RD1]|uniref:hypothetical protein n=1 Tax=Actinoplanes sp. RD1 TaxID=3064538 RepID=UPI0027403CAA|nr:hypothetical protein [Actinoplanes sp. RD1]